MNGTCIVIPAHNEADNILEMVTRCQRFGTVIVVDDGSTDNTNALLRAQRIPLVTNPTGSQHGDGIRAGLHYALEYWGAENIVTIDAGLSYFPESIPTLLGTLYDCDLAIGSRVMDGAWRQQPWGRRLLTTLGTRLLGALTDCTTLDYASFRAYTPAAARRVLELGATLDQRCHVFNPALIYLLQRSGLTIRQVPVSYTATNSTLDLSATLGALWALLCLWQAKRWEKETACPSKR